MADVYVHYVNKVERKDRTEAELVKVITWLTGFDSKTLKSHLKKRTTFKEFFKAAKIHPNAKLITGSMWREDCRNSGLANEEDSLHG